MKSRTVQILRIAISLCLFLAITLIPTVVFAQNETFSITEKVIANEKTVWRYLDNNTDPAANSDNINAWTQKNFDDSEWKSGSGCFGNKSGKLQTIFIGAENGYTPNILIDLNDGVSGSDNYKTYFFRTKLNVETLDDLYAFSVELNADDAAVVYFNGKIVIDTRVTVNNSTNLYYSSSSNQIYRYWFSREEAEEFLTVGENTVAVSLHNANSTSSDLLFDFDSSLFYSHGAEPHGFDDVVMSVGSDETERNLTWYTRSTDAGEVQVAKAEDMNGDKFPDTYSTFSATTEKAVNSPGEYSNKATISSLLENTEYVYRLKCGSKYSEVYNFKTESFKSFDVIVFCDPQIRSWTDTLETPDYVYWNDSISKISENFNADLYISAGDQVNVHDEEKDYAHFITEHLASTPIAPTYGNHENGSTIFNDHYNLPNSSNSLNANYWFTYNNVLFININNLISTTDKHLAFIEEAVTLNPDCEWRVITMHYSPFSGGSHSNNSAVKTYREDFAPHLNDLGIDLVIGGHDHVYARSYLMDGNAVALDQSGIDSNGVLYVCAGSAGGKFYDPITNAEGSEAIAFSHNDQSRTATHLSITDNELSLTTYLLDDMSVIDTYTLYHTDSARLSDAIATAKDTLSKAESIVSESMLTAIKSVINDAETMLANINLYTSDEINSTIKSLSDETASLSETVVNYNKLSTGAKSTDFDKTSSLKIVHLEADGVYTLEGGGSKVDVNLIKHNSDGTTTTVFTWKEGATYLKRSTTNPYVAFILDGDVTFNSLVTFEYTNLLVDLKGHSITFNTDGKYHINVKAASSIEFRGKGKVVAGTGTVDYFLYTAQYIGSVTFNGDITFVDGTSNLKNAFFIKGDALIHGTFTVDSSYDTSSGIFFSVQGSRSSADERKGIISIENATVNYNNRKGAPLFSATGISGESSADGKIYTSIPEVNITNSRLNLLGPMISSKWGADTVTGYGASKSDSLINCVNTTALNITDSYIYSDIHLTYAITMTPSGHTTVNITRSTLYSEHGVLIQGIANNTLILNAEDSTFFAGTTNAESATVGAELGLSTTSYLRGEILLVPGNTLGTANFDNCSLTAAYRVIEGSNDTLSARIYTTFLKDSSISLTDGGGHIFTRVNVVFDGGLINCRSGSISYKATPYDPDTGKGLLVKGTVTILNFNDSMIDSEVTTVSAYKALAEADSSVYSTILTTGYFTVADDFNVLSITHEDNLDGKYAFLLYSDNHAPVLTLHKGVAPTCTESGVKDYYTCFCGDNFADAEGTILVENLETWLPIAALGHTAGETVTENNVAPDCTENGSYDSVVYCTVCDAEISRINTVVPAKGHTNNTPVTENSVDPTCTTNGSYDIVIYCSVCGCETSRETVSISALGHTDGDWITDTNATCEDTGMKHKACTVCGITTITEEISALGHTIVVDVAVAPTCTENGLTEGTHCSVCNETIVAQNSVPSLGHTDSAPVTENSVAPTCTVDGNYETVVYCTVCDIEISRTSITVSALGHTDGETLTENNTDPTCTTDGSYDLVVYCTVCDAEISRINNVVSATGHTEVTVAGKAPTCTESGLTDGKQCSVCGEITVAQTTVSALGHTDGNPVTENETEPTCTENGSYETVVYCTVCGTEVSRTSVTVSAPGHTAGETVTENNTDPTCTTDGNYDLVVYCTVCNEEISRETTTTQAIGHTGVIIPGYSATCTESGLTDGLNCYVCGEVLTAQSELSANGHNCNSVATAPTCEADGYITYTCVDCNYSYTSDKVDALGHLWIEATTEAPKTCENCGATEGEKLPETTPEVDTTVDNSENYHDNASAIEKFWCAIVNFFRRLLGLPDKCICNKK